MRPGSPDPDSRPARPEFLSDEQIARYGRFPEESSTEELEQYFRLDPGALDALAPGRAARPG
ncbi:DUF4158 domain-containing protein [Spongiactinospora sp. TRM90649]|uniref:DUF4158 domain-containing protein n=1 Tax=Spongiactinospora sp. TRM90649 TaxID=3031114 RepID=UPI0023F8E95A|nr:DUF4158 domain-containing protein [Spongiactinospora sp. TRM90649]MDF5758832.1 DUF4158 domain-containing protein [Spongiactinospora sp. TRM90649]